MLTFSGSVQAQSQTSIGQEDLQLVHQAIDSIYNLNFEAADPVIAKLNQRIPDYPGVSLLEAFYDYWKYRPIKSGTPAFKQFEKHLERTLELSDKLFEKNEDDVEATFFSLAAHAYLAQLYAENHIDLKALGEAKSAYGYIKKGFGLLDKFPEFYFPCGIYDYYRVKYPEEHPFFKPFVWFFRDGDKEKGIELLKKGAQFGLFTKAECLTYLFHIYMRYENKPALSVQYCRKLNELYPNNLNYIALNIENEIYLNDFASMWPQIEKLLSSDKAHYHYVGEVYKGIYYEKYMHDFTIAKQAYLTAKDIITKTDVGTDHEASLLYLGLGRVQKMSGDSSAAKDSFKHSVKLAEYGFVRDEANRYLDNL